jgi:hypothetical protein
MSLSADEIETNDLWQRFCCDDLVCEFCVDMNGPSKLKNVVTIPVYRKRKLTATIDGDIFPFRNICTCLEGNTRQSFVHQGYRFYFEILIASQGQIQVTDDDSAIFKIRTVLSCTFEHETRLNS